MKPHVDELSPPLTQGLHPSRSRASGLFSSLMLSHLLATIIDGRRMASTFLLSGWSSFLCFFRQIA